LSHDGLLYHSDEHVVLISWRLSSL